MSIVMPQSPFPSKHEANFRDAFTPKSVVCLREGYGKKFFFNDLFSGVTVGLIALPLALAFAIASHVPPAAGLYTAIVGGFIISALGGSRVQIGGPTGAFVVIVAGVVDQFGYDGLVLATLMAGVMMIAMGLLRFGGMIKFIPYPATTGFTAGIAVIIFSGQIKDFFGLQITGNVPADVMHQWRTYCEAWQLHGPNWTAFVIGGLGLILLVTLRKFAPKIPGAIVAVGLAALAVWIFGLDDPNSRFHVETIGSRFGTALCPSGIPSSLPAFHFPRVSWETLAEMRRLMPAAGTIAILAAIESLLSAVVADGMIGGRHKSNCELVAQGTANIGSVLFGGIPATGAIARTAANVKCGGKTPLAGVIHAVTLLLFMLLLAPYASKIPLAVFASVLMVVAWNMSERDHFRHLLKAPKSDIAVLLLTFGLTVFVDLTVGVGVGLVLAALTFMRRMSEVTSLNGVRDEMTDAAACADEFPDLNDPNSLTRRDVPSGVEVYEINGPFFFGAADLLKDALNDLERPPKVFILRMRYVPVIDATGLHALEEFYEKCRKQNITLLLAGIHAQPVFALTDYGLLDRITEEHTFGNIDDALNYARQIIGLPAAPRPADAVAEVARERKV